MNNKKQKETPLHPNKTPFQKTRKKKQKTKQKFNCKNTADE